MKTTTTILLYLVLWAILPGLSEDKSRLVPWIQSVKRFLRSVREAFREEFATTKRTGSGAGEQGPAGGAETLESR